MVQERRMVERAYVWIFGESLLVLGGLSFVLLSMAYETGFRCGRRRFRRPPDREGVGTITAGMLGLLSFTLGLAIGYAQDRAEARRGLIVKEANAIGTAWLRAKVVAGQEGSTIAQLIEELAKVELAFAVAKSTEPEAELLARRGALQDQIWDLTQTVAGRNPTPVTTAMMIAINEMFDAELSERFAFDSRVPVTLSWMLLCGSLLAIGGMGYQFGLSDNRHPLLVRLDPRRSRTANLDNREFRNVASATLNSSAWRCVFVRKSSAEPTRASRTGYTIVGGRHGQFGAVTGKPDETTSRSRGDAHDDGCRPHVDGVDTNGSFVA
jgi:hypothetical protein